MRISVWNKGKEIPPEILRRVFEPFFTTKTFGTGLGLSICKRIVEEHGGNITAQSDSNGTIFVVSLPQGGMRMEDKKIMIVDDEENMRFLLTEELGEEGFHVITAASAEEALDLFEKHPDISLVTIDIEMPGISGLELAGMLRNKKPDLKNCVAHRLHTLQTGYGLMGCRRYVVKSTDLREFKETIKKLLD